MADNDDESGGSSPEKTYHTTTYKGHPLTLHWASPEGGDKDVMVAVSYGQGHDTVTVSSTSTGRKRKAQPASAAVGAGPDGSKKKCLKTTSEAKGSGQGQRNSAAAKGGGVQKDEKRGYLDLSNNKCSTEEVRKRLAENPNVKILEIRNCRKTTYNALVLALPTLKKLHSIDVRCEIEYPKDLIEKLAKSGLKKVRLSNIMPSNYSKLEELLESESLKMIELKCKRGHTEERERFMEKLVRRGADAAPSKPVIFFSFLGSCQKWSQPGLQFVNCKLSEVEDAWKGN